MWWFKSFYNYCNHNKSHILECLQNDRPCCHVLSVTVGLSLNLHFYMTWSKISRIAINTLQHIFSFKFSYNFWISYKITFYLPIVFALLRILSCSLYHSFFCLKHSFPTYSYKPFSQGIFTIYPSLWKFSQSTSYH